MKGKARSGPATLGCALVLLLLCGCAQTRYLSAEQDEQMRAHCEPDGCAVIPAQQWEAIEKILQMLRGV